ncbi:MAG: DUF1841 family protein [Ferrovum sp.]|nr:DUF1841 family protein [Ferrovum sp.]NDU88112.1 DUF1841 family protein [Ferrovum sp.]
MFSPSRDQVRDFFLHSWQKHRAGSPLTSLELMAVEIIGHHPETHALFDTDPETLHQREWGPEDGVMNPFLHLSLHLAVEEQLGIDQPPGIQPIYQALCRQYGDEHEARHRLLECLGQVLWDSQRQGRPPDNAQYLALLQATLKG